MRVGVIGAGLSGLRSAQLLTQAGCEVVVFEARHRIGGRIWTVKDWQYEAGGEWIDSDHERMIALVAELGLETERAPGKRGGVWRGEYRTTDVLWPDALEAEETFWSLAKSHTAAPGETLADLIAIATESDRSGWWLTANLRSDEGTDPQNVGLAEWLEFYRLYQDREGGEVSALRVKGGMGQLCEGLAAGLTIRLNTPVSAITQSNDRALIDDEPFDHVVVAIPPGCVRRIAFRPELPESQKIAYEKVGMAPIVKAIWRTDEAPDGNTLWDTPRQQTWNGSRGGTPIMTAYICGSDAQNLAAEGVDGLSKIEAWAHSGRRLHDWVSDPWAGGGFSFVTPGLGPYQHWLSEPFGRIHFAGEHAATWMGFFEGTLESAERVKEEILSHPTDR